MLPTTLPEIILLNKKISQMETNTYARSIIPHFFTHDDYGSVMDAVADRIITSHLTHYTSSLIREEIV